MRDYKFRVWDEKAKKMVYENLGFYLFFDPEIWKNNRLIPYSNRPAKIMQWTGLKDRKGRDIYEGDILGFKNATKNRSLLVEVFFSEGCFRTRFLNSSREFNSPVNKMILESAKVVGNIFENPELIEVES